MSAPTRPLPECLTRLLSGTGARVFAPTPGDFRRGQELSRGEAKPGGALESVVLRGFVWVVSGLVWGAVLWSFVRHFLP